MIVLAPQSPVRGDGGEPEVSKCGDPMKRQVRTARCVVAGGRLTYRRLCDWVSLPAPSTREMGSRPPLLLAAALNKRTGV